MNILPASFYLLLLCGTTTFSMELFFTKKETQEPIKETHESIAAKNFIQQFPLMTFNAAKTEFETLNKEIQPLVWKKIDQMTDDPNKILKIALIITTLLPQELQYKILSGDFSYPADIEKIMKKKNIYEHFRWRAIINTRLRNNNGLTISYPLYKTTATYTIPELELFKRGDIESITFNDFPQPMQDNLIHYFRYSFAPSDEAKKILKTIPIHTLRKIGTIYSELADHNADTRTIRYDILTMYQLTKDICDFLINLKDKNNKVFDLFFNNDNKVNSRYHIKNNQFFMRYKYTCSFLQRTLNAGFYTIFFVGLVRLKLAAPLAMLCAYFLPIHIINNETKWDQITPPELITKMAGLYIISLTSSFGLKAAVPFAIFLACFLPVHIRNNAIEVGQPTHEKGYLSLQDNIDFYSRNDIIIIEGY